MYFKSKFFRYIPQKFTFSVKNFSNRLLNHTVTVYFFAHQGKIPTKTATRTPANSASKIKNSRQDHPRPFEFPTKLHCYSGKHKLKHRFSYLFILPQTCRRATNTDFLGRPTPCDLKRKQSILNTTSKIKSSRQGHALPFWVPYKITLLLRETQIKTSFQLSFYFATNFPHHNSIPSF